MNTEKSTEKKTDLFWIMLSIVSLGTGLYIYQAGKAYSLSLMLAFTYQETFNAVPFQPPPDSVYPGLPVSHCKRSTQLAHSLQQAPLQNGNHWHYHFSGEFYTLCVQYKPVLCQPMNVMNTTSDNPSKTSQPNQPVASFVQEANNLYTWCQNDVQALKRVGISAEMIEELRLRAAACREAEAIWNQYRNTQSKVQKQWQQMAPEAVRLRTELLSIMRFAFRKAPDLLHKTAAISSGTGYAGLIQDLNDIALLGRQHIGLLNKIETNPAYRIQTATQ